MGNTVLRLLSCWLLFIKLLYICPVKSLVKYSTCSLIRDGKHWDTDVFRFMFCMVDRQGRPQDFFQRGHRRWKGSVVGGHHGECGAPAYNGGLGANPSGVQGQSPWSGGRSPPEAESILVIGCPTEPANLAPFQKCICISTLGATVMTWEKFMSKSRGSCDPPCPFLGAPM